jgi:hypothetical protein
MISLVIYKDVYLKLDEQREGYYIYCRNTGDCLDWWTSWTSYIEMRKEIEMRSVA